MTRLSLTALALVLTLPAAPVLAQSTETPAEAPETPAEAPVVEGLETVPQKYSYGLGLQIGQTLRQQGIDEGLDPAAFAMGIQDYLSDNDPRISFEEVQIAYQAMQAVLAEQAQQALGEAQARADAFLAENAKAEGITVTESGLQYRILEEGDGVSPTPEDVVKVHYEGKLIDGTVFDSSILREEPAQFPVGGVIAGWTEALQLMKPGAVWEVWLPPAIAYGERGAGADIGPNEVLQFRIELIEIVAQ